MAMSDLKCSWPFLRPTLTLPTLGSHSLRTIQESLLSWVPPRPLFPLPELRLLCAHGLASPIKSQALWGTTASCPLSCLPGSTTSWRPLMERVFCKSRVFGLFSQMNNSLVGMMHRGKLDHWFYQGGGTYIQHLVLMAYDSLWDYSHAETTLWVNMELAMNPGLWQRVDKDKCLLPRGVSDFFPSYRFSLIKLFLRRKSVFFSVKPLTL